MTAEPVVTVVMPAYNACRWIGSALESACGQTLRDIEIIVVDDGSTDGTAGMVQTFAERDPRIRLIQIKNAGVGAARNVGIRAARGRYIAPLDADDVWAPEKLEKQVDVMEEGGEEFGLVYCWSQHIDESGRRLMGTCAHSVEGNARRQIILENFIGCASVPLFRAEALRQVGLYLTRDEQGGAQGCEDWDLAIRVAENYRVGVVKEALVDYRQATSAMSTRVDGMAKSFRILMHRARKRNHDLPSLLFRCAKSHFNAFLAAKAYRNGDDWGCVRMVAHAVRADPMNLLNRDLVRFMVKSGISLASAGRWRGIRGNRAHRPPGFERLAAAVSERAGSPRLSFYRRIQARRRERVVPDSF